MNMSKGEKIMTEWKNGQPTEPGRYDCEEANGLRSFRILADEDVEFQNLFSPVIRHFRIPDPPEPLNPSQKTK